MLYFIMVFILSLGHTSSSCDPLFTTTPLQRLQQQAPGHLSFIYRDLLAYYQRRSLKELNEYLVKIIEKPVYHDLLAAYHRGHLDQHNLASIAAYHNLLEASSLKKVKKLDIKLQWEQHGENQSVFVLADLKHALQKPSNKITWLSTRDYFKRKQDQNRTSYKFVSPTWVPHTFTKTELLHALGLKGYQYYEKHHQLHVYRLKTNEDLLAALEPKIPLVYRKFDSQSKTYKDADNFQSNVIPGYTDNWLPEWVVRSQPLLDLVLDSRIDNKDLLHYLLLSK